MDRNVRLFSAPTSDVRWRSSMNSVMSNRLPGPQQTALVILRTLIGWHFLYEGYYKLLSPAWSAEGKPLQPWSSTGYLKAATGPLARLFQWLIDAGWIG